ncbi:uncharacterized protein K02A2.6-like [Daphnia carinata]|uniref:uncharacterized protein K02A2.6-like n=1 Tax=Daphnia carinata TaxID=120202 RepID=UPI00257E4C5C|nr:uncharacterized protein K02A2.6-like [Daphnia carinata]
MAEFGLRPPGAFNFDDSDQASQWDSWKNQFNWFLKATKKNKEDEDVQVSVLITCLGLEGAKIYDSFVFADQGDKLKINPILLQFDNHFRPQKSETFERFKFMSRRQAVDEPFDKFLLDLKSLIASCNYDTQQDSLLRDQIVFSIVDNDTREQLLCQSTLGLKKTVEICRARESARKLACQMQQGTEASQAQAHVNLLNSSKGFSSTRKTHSSKESANGFSCRYCGNQHPRGKCPAYGKTYAKCGLENHFAKVCEQSAHHQTQRGQSKRLDRTEGKYNYQQQQNQANKNCSSLQTDTEVTPEEFIISSIVSTDMEDSWFVNLHVDGVSVKFKVDTGAQCNVMPKHLYDSVVKTKVLQPGPRVTAYNRQPVRVVGQQRLNVTYKCLQFKVLCVIAEEVDIPVLGLPSCKQMNVVRLVDSVEIPQALNSGSEKSRQVSINTLLNKYAAVFKGIGKLPTKHHIQLKQGVAPVVRPARRIPFKIRSAVLNKLSEMENLRLIQKVSEPTEWVSPMVVARKSNGDIRICLDPYDLNKAIKRQHFQVPSAQEIFSRIGKARYFSTLDATSGFLQVQLTEESTFLTTMATPFGRYRFLRLPFGLSSSPEAYQQMMTELFGDLPGVEIYFDDFFVWGETLEEHNSRLESLFERCAKVSLKLNMDKCKFLQPEIKYIGHIIGNKVLKPDPEKVAAITSFKQPENKQDIQRFLGMVNYLAKFCDTLSERMSPLRVLLKADTEWQWDANTDRVFESIKSSVSKLPVLRLFDSSLPVVLSVDASPIGVGAVLMQRGQPIEFASRTLTDTQQRYAQIEKELLAVQFGLQHFHQYVYGQTVSVETDHKPLIGIHHKPIASCSPRIQRMRLLMQIYDFELVYKPGKDLHVADALSRAPETRQYVEDPAQRSDECVNMVVLSLAVTPTSQEKFVAATAADPTLIMVAGLVRKGWPEHKKNCHPAAKPFWLHRSDLSEYGGLLLKGEQVVVPVALQPEVLRQIHEGHLGISKCIERAKLTVYWPNYVDQITNMVEACNMCQDHRHQNSNQPCFPVAIPDYAFQKVATDLYEIAGVHYLLVIDYYSRWPCAAQLRGITSASVVEELKRIFVDFGFPEQLVSDNGKQFDSSEFRRFCNRYDIRLTTSSPEYPKSNGLAERTVQTVKESFIKSKGEGKTLLDVLQVLRSTPVGNGLPTPAVLLQKRNLRGGLLFTKRALTFKEVDEQAVKALLQRRQANQAFSSSMQTKALPVLTVGTPVRVRVSKKWIEGVVKSVCPQPNSYIVNTNCGRLFRRNRQAINVNKAALSQFKKPTSVGIEDAQRPRPVNTPRVIRTSAPFLREWNSTVVDPNATTSTNRNVTQEQHQAVENLNSPEDSREAFHGFEPAAQSSSPTRGSARRSNSMEARVSVQDQQRPNRPRSVCSGDERVTRSGLRYGINK